MRKTTIGIFNTVIYFLLLLPFFKPAYVGNVLHSVNKIYNVLQICSILIIFLLYLKRGKCSKFVIAISIYEGALLFITFLRGANIQESFINMLQVIAICMIIEYGLSKNKKELISALLAIFEILIYINFITLILYPKGMYINSISGVRSNWFLGYDNSHVTYFIVGIVLSFINATLHQSKWKVRTWCLIIICTLSVIIRFSGTTVLGFFIFIMYFLFVDKLYKIKCLNMKNYVIFFVIAFLIIVVFRFQEVFSYVIVDVLKKDLTFSGRTMIWDNVIKYIEQKPLLGFGIENTLVRIEKYKYIEAVNAHNIVLEIMYQSGVCGLAIYSYVIGIITKKLSAIKENKVVGFISIAIFVLLTMMIVEVYNLVILIVLYCLAYNIEKIVEPKIGEKFEKSKN